MPEPVIAVDRLVHRYEGASLPALDGLSFSMKPGEILGLLGPNGAGKTTTLQIILGLLVPTGGQVRVFGCSPARDRLQILPRVNFASVDVDLPTNLLVGECLTIFARLYSVPNSRRRVEELTQRFDLSRFTQQPIGRLSAGEQMRLKLCKALLNEPELLILDEPTLSLDPYMAQNVRDLLKSAQAQRGMSILHTSHNMQEVQAFCDRILFLHQGRCLAEGPPAQVLERFKSRSLDELFIRVAKSGDLFHGG